MCRQKGNATGNAQYAILMFDQKRWLGYATSVISGLMVDGASSVVRLGYRMRIIVVCPSSNSLRGRAEVSPAECTRLEKDRDGCPKVINLGSSRTDLFFEVRTREMYPD